MKRLCPLNLVINKRDKKGLMQNSMQTEIISAVYKFFKHVNSHFNTGCVLFHLVFSAHFQHLPIKQSGMFM